MKFIPKFATIGLALFALTALNAQTTHRATGLVLKVDQAKHLIVTQPERF